VKVKICGITNQKDALVASKAGADALGFVFYDKSPRYITPQKAKEIVEKLPPFVMRVGLFVNCKSDFVNDVCNFAKMDLAQIHFEADEDFYNRLKIKHIKVVRAKEKKDVLRYQNEYRIVDAFVESYGGEGKRIDIGWFDDIDTSKIILAGGLTPQNVLDVKGLGFYALDVSSGVEIEKGKKDHQKIKDFIEAVKNE
jgi:phosphoribosylanthranilate isomerase